MTSLSFGLWLVETSRMVARLAMLALLAFAVSPAFPSSARVSWVAVSWAPGPANVARAQPADFGPDGDSHLEDEDDRLFAMLAEAANEQEARVIENDIWHYWMTAPDQAASERMAAAMAARRAFDLAGALDIVDDLIARHAGYAEAWNQRATLLFMMGRLDESLEAIDQTLQREPRHFGALAGRGLILMQQGRMALGQEALRQATRIHPYLKERHLLVPVPGQDL